MASGRASGLPGRPNPPGGTGDPLADAPTLTPDGSHTRPLGTRSREELTTLRRGSPLGRYFVLDVLGRGGMGVVYAAYDPELDRKIAVKLVKWGSVGSSDAGRSRLLREAQALAKLSHRNVVTVYDVGTYEDSIFVAMEFVEGKTLTKWSQERQAGGQLPAWRDVLDVYAPAARALHAAHEAGIVHRDFKPDNAMIDARGRVVVLDFGLARPTASHSSDPQPDDSSSPGFSSSSSFATPLTVTGTLMGTPAFMSPEQLGGRETNASSDQFSFCVSLWSALYGERPFAGETIRELCASVFEQRFRPSPKGSRVPTWLRRALLRGMALRPDDRHPSMAALLDALQTDPARRRRRIVTGAVALGVLVGAGFSARALRPDDPTCAEIPTELEAAWSPERRRAIESAFRLDAKAYSEETLERVLAELDRWSASWLERRTAACEAAKGTDRAVVTEANVRAACLDGRLQRFGALTRVLGEADQGMVAKALGAIQGLPAPADCEDESADRRPPPIPDDPAAQERVESVRARAADVEVFHETGQSDLAAQLATTLLEEARAIGFAPLVAEMALALGTAEVQSGRYTEALEHLEESALIYRREGLDEDLIPTSFQLIYLHTVFKTEYELADWMLRDVAALVTRFGDRPERRARALLARGRLEAARDDFEAATRAIERAVAVYDEHGASDLTKIFALDILGSTYMDADRPNDSLGALDRSEALAKDSLGPAHPLRGNILTHKSRALAARGRDDESVATIEEALAIYEGAYGPSHPNVAAALNSLGLRLEKVGRPEEAAAALARAESILVQGMGPEHPQVLTARHNRGNTLRRLGRAEEALELHRPTAELRARVLAAGSESIFETRDNLADDLRALGRCDEAEPEYRRAIADREHLHGANVTTLVHPLTGLGLCRLRAGDVDGALELLERAVAVAGEADGEADAHARARLALAMALRKAGRDPARVDELVSRAREQLVQRPRFHPVLLDELERFASGREVADLTY